MGFIWVVIFIVAVCVGIAQREEKLQQKPAWENWIIDLCRSAVLAKPEPGDGLLVPKMIAQYEKAHGWRAPEEAYACIYFEQRARELRAEAESSRRKAQACIMEDEIPSSWVEG